MSSNATESFYSTTFKININQSDICKFWGRVERGSETECWPWLSSKSKLGYGKMSIGRKHIRANRFALVASGIEIPENMCACHTCDNPSCCNPNHLWIGSQADNQKDRAAKGRSSRGERNPSKTHPELFCGEKHHASILTEEIVSELRRNPPIGLNISAESLKYSISPGGLRAAIVGSTWRHVPAMSPDNLRAFLNANPPIRVRITRRDAEIVREQLKLGLGVKEVSSTMGIHHRTVQRILSGQCWK